MYVMMGEIRKIKTKNDLSDHPDVIFPEWIIWLGLICLFQGPCFYFDLTHLNDSTSLGKIMNNELTTTSANISHFLT